MTKKKHPSSCPSCGAQLMYISADYGYCIDESCGWQTPKCLCDECTLGKQECAFTGSERRQQVIEVLEKLKIESKDHAMICSFITSKNYHEGFAAGLEKAIYVITKECG